MNKMKGHIQFYRQWWFWVLIITIAIVVFRGINSSTNTENSAPTQETSANQQYINDFTYYSEKSAKVFKQVEEVRDLVNKKQVTNEQALEVTSSLTEQLDGDWDNFWHKDAPQEYRQFHRTYSIAVSSQNVAYANYNLYLATSNSAILIKVDHNLDEAEKNFEIANNIKPF